MGNSNNKLQVQQHRVAVMGGGTQRPVRRIKAHHKPVHHPKVAAPHRRHMSDRATLKGGGKPPLSKEQVVNIALAALKQIEAYLLSTGMSPDKLTEMEQMMLAKLHGILEAEGPQGIKNYLNKSPYKSSFEDLVQALDTHVHDATKTGQNDDEEDVHSTGHQATDDDDDNNDAHKQAIEDQPNQEGAVELSNQEGAVEPSNQGGAVEPQTQEIERPTQDATTNEDEIGNDINALMGGNTVTEMFKRGVHLFLNNTYIRALVDLFFVLSILTFYFK